MEQAADLWILLVEDARTLEDGVRMRRSALDLCSVFDSHAYLLRGAKTSRAIALLEEALDHSEVADKVEQNRLLARLAQAVADGKSFSVAALTLRQRFFPVTGSRPAYAIPW